MSFETQAAGAGADDASVGSQAWSNPGNVTAEDATNASVGLSSSETSHYLKATQFGFAIPATATIVGVLVRVKRKADNVTLLMADDAVKLTVGGSVVGDNKADTLTNWPSSLGFAEYGGSGDMWGLTASTLNPTNVNASTFGVVVAVNAQGAMGPENAYIDYIEITITYNDVGVDTPLVEVLYGEPQIHYEPQPGDWFGIMPEYQTLDVAVPIIEWPPTSHCDYPDWSIAYQAGDWHTSSVPLTIVSPAAPLDWLPVPQPEVWRDYVFAAGDAFYAVPIAATISVIDCVCSGTAALVLAGAGTARIVAATQHADDEDTPLPGNGTGTAKLIAAGAGTAVLVADCNC